MPMVTYSVVTLYRQVFCSSTACYRTVSVLKMTVATYSKVPNAIFYFILVSYIYVAIWMLVVPLVPEETTAVHALFPSPFHAVRAIVCFLCILTTSIGLGKLPFLTTCIMKMI